jgi:hypothetical protein
MCTVSQIFKKNKSKAVPLRHAGAKQDRKYSSYSLLTSALDGVSGQRHTPSALYPRVKDPDPQYPASGCASELV